MCLYTCMDGCVVREREREREKERERCAPALVVVRKSVRFGGRKS